MSVANYLNKTTNTIDYDRDNKFEMKSLKTDEITVNNKTTTDNLTVNNLTTTDEITVNNKTTTTEIATTKISSKNGPTSRINMANALTIQQDTNDTSNDNLLLLKTLDPGWIFQRFEGPNNSFDIGLDNIENIKMRILPEANNKQFVFENVVNFSKPVVLNNGTTDPTGLPIGSMYYNTTTNKFKGLTNTGWVDLH